MRRGPFHDKEDLHPNLRIRILSTELFGAQEMAAISPERRLRVFISYSRKDIEAAERLRDRLLAIGYEAYLDKHDILPGEPWQERLAKLIETADTVVFLVSHDSVTSEICDWEVNEAERSSKRILPVVIRDTPAEKIPGRLKRLNYIFLRGPEEEEDGLAKLAKALQVDIAWIREHTRLGELAADWKRGGNAPELQLRGSALAAAELWLSRHQPAGQTPTDLQRSFVIASREGEQSRAQAEKQQLARTQRFQKRAAWALGTVAILLVIGLAAVLWQVRQTSRREASVFTSKAEDAFEQGYCDRALRLAVAGLPPPGALPISYISTELEAALSRYATACRLIRSLPAQAEIESATFSADGFQLVTLSRDHTAQLWDIANGRIKHVFSGHPARISQATLSPDGHRVLTLSDDNTARVWDGTSGEQLYLVQKNSLLNGKFSHDGRYLLIGSKGEVSLLDVEKRTQISSFKGSEALYTPDGHRVMTKSENVWHLWDTITGDRVATTTDEIAYTSGNSKILVTTSASDGRARLISAETGAEIAMLEQYNGNPGRASFDSDAHLLLMDFDGGAGLWDAATGKLLHRFKGEYEYDRILLSPDGKRALTTTTNHVELWDTTKGVLLGILLRRFKPYGGEFSPDSQRIVLPSYNEAIIFSADSGQELERLRGQSGYLDVEFSPDGTKFVTYGGWDKSIRLWRIDEGSNPPVWFPLMWKPSLSPDGRWLLGVLESSNAPSILDTATGKEMHTFLGHGDDVHTTRFSPNGRLVLTASSEKIAHLWDAETGNQIRAFEQTAAVTAAEFSPNGKCIIVASKDRVANIYDTDTGVKLRILKLEAGKPAWSKVSFNKTGERVLVTIDDALSLHDANSGALLASWKAKDGPKTSFSADGSILTTISSDNSARLLDARTGSELHAFRVDGDEPHNISFSPDGRRVLLELSKHSRLFDRDTGREIRRFEGTRAFFNADGRLIVATFPDQTARVLDVESGSIRQIIDGRELGSDGALSTDGRFFVSRTGDTSVPVWDARDWSRIRILKGHDSRVDLVRFTPDGRIMTQDKSGNVALWTLEPIALMKPERRRDEVCRDHLIGADTFSDEEMLDSVLIGQEDLRKPCSRVGPMQFAYYEDAFRGFASGIRAALSYALSLKRFFLRDT
jgi:WD40 repeat protein